MGMKMTLAELRARYHFDIADLARAAQVTTTEVVYALRGQAISESAARAILDTMSRQTGQRYTFDNVEIVTA